VASRLMAAKERLRKELAHERPNGPEVGMGTLTEDGVPSD
jgi:hypothetical protein